MSATKSNTHIPEDKAKKFNAFLEQNGLDIEIFQ